VSRAAIYRADTGSCCSRQTFAQVGKPCCKYGASHQGYLYGLYSMVWQVENTLLELTIYTEASVHRTDHASCLRTGVVYRYGSIVRQSSAVISCNISRLYIENIFYCQVSELLWRILKAVQRIVWWCYRNRYCNGGVQIIGTVLYIIAYAGLRLVILYFPSFVDDLKLFSLQPCYRSFRGRSDCANFRTLMT
jgi:hypothetical protein